MKVVHIYNLNTALIKKLQNREHTYGVFDECFKSQNLCVRTHVSYFVVVSNQGVDNGIWSALKLQNMYADKVLSVIYIR